MLVWCTRNGRRGNVLIVTSVTTPRNGAAPQSPRHCKRCSAELSSEGHDSSKGSPLPQTPRMRCSWSIANPWPTQGAHAAGEHVSCLDDRRVPPATFVEQWPDAPTPLPCNSRRRSSPFQRCHRCRGCEPGTHVDGPGLWLRSCRCGPPTADPERTLVRPALDAVGEPVGGWRHHAGDGAIRCRH